MMEDVIRVSGNGCRADEGHISLDLPKTLWNGSMLFISVVFAIPTFTIDAFLFFLIFTYFTLLIGHSVGMHRMMIHRTFQAPKWLERSLIYIGVLVGVAGPMGILKIHDIRDWAQRQAHCHDFFSHRRSIFKDLSWQLFCKFEFDKSPQFYIESNIADDIFYRFLERTWRFHQIALAILLYAIGGWSWVVWGICVRIIISAAGHWAITYFCHQHGEGRWDVGGASVQASNLRGLGWLTYGECWHNNHHAFPESARIGLEKGQPDPAWWVIKNMEKLGLIRNVGLPRAIESREDLIAR